MQKGYFRNRTTCGVTTCRVTHRVGRQCLGGFLALVQLGVIAGCARPQRAEEPPPAESTEPALPPTLNLTELESLEHDLRQSEARVDAELARKSELANATPAPASEAPDDETSSEPRKSADSVAPGAPGPGRPPDTAETSSAPPASPRHVGERGSPCDSGCRALASMRRAQARICEIAGPGSRCQGAIQRVEAAVERLRGAGCECLPSENR